MLAARSDGRIFITSSLEPFSRTKWDTVLTPRADGLPCIVASRTMPISVLGPAATVGFNATTTTPETTSTTTATASGVQAR